MYLWDLVLYVAHGLRFKHFRLVLSVIFSFVQLNNQLKSTSVSKKGLKIGKMCGRCDQILDHERPVIDREHVMWAWALWMWFFFCLVFFFSPFFAPWFSSRSHSSSILSPWGSGGAHPTTNSVVGVWLSLASGKTSTSLPAIVTRLGTDIWSDPANGN